MRGICGDLEHHPIAAPGGEPPHDTLVVGGGDRQAVVEVILRMGQLMVDLPEVAEVEVNPLRVLPEGQGALALDARLRRSV